MSDFNREIILDHYKHPHNFGNLKSSDKSATVANPLCGDKIKLELKIAKGKIIDIAFSGEGCAIMTASASLLTDHVKGKKITAIKKMNNETVLSLLNIKINPVRMKCAMLPLVAIRKALGIKNEE